MTRIERIYADLTESAVIRQHPRHPRSMAFSIRRNSAWHYGLFQRRNRDRQGDGRDAQAADREAGDGRVSARCGRRSTRASAASTNCAATRTAWSAASAACCARRPARPAPSTSRRRRTTRLHPTVAGRTLCQGLRGQPAALHLLRRLRGSLPDRGDRARPRVRHGQLQPPTISS